MNFELPQYGPSQSPSANPALPRMNLMGDWSGVRVMNMTQTRSALEWCSYFDSWYRHELRGQVYLSPPSGVVSASDFAALDKSGASFARVEIRETPHHGLWLCFAPSGAWREYLRLRQAIESSGESDVVDTEWIDDRKTPTERILCETMRSMLSRAATR